MDINELNKDVKERMNKLKAKYDKLAANKAGELIYKLNLEFPMEPEILNKILEAYKLGVEDGTAIGVRQGKLNFIKDLSQALEHEAFGTIDDMIED